MPTAITASLTSWRTLLLLTASVIALALAAAPAPAAANNECGLPVAGVVTCPVDAVGPDYPDGITYNAASDRTINIDDGVSIIGAAGVTLNNSAGNGAINAPGVTIDSDLNGVVATNAGNGSATVTVAGDISAAGHYGVRASTKGAGAATATFGSGAISMGADGARGVSAAAFGWGDATASSSGDISMTGDHSVGLSALSHRGAASATSTGTITVEGVRAHGIVAVARGPVTVEAGDVTATGEGARGVVAVSKRDTIEIIVNGNVQGGWDAAEPLGGYASHYGGHGFSSFAAGVVASARSGYGAITLTNNGAIGALNDRAIIGQAPIITINNAGNVTGFVRLLGDEVTFNNTSSDSFDIRNFADTDGDFVRDTEGVAISHFGGAGVFNNDADGAVNLLNISGATTIDTSFALAPEYGDPADYDITLEGVEQGQLRGLAQFNHAGSIVLQDAMTGGDGPVAGDVLAITGGYHGTAAFVSNGGSLWLDTVLDEGGAASTLSDVLMLDAVTLGSGPTQVFIANAGGQGAQTIDNGILLVDVLSPAASAANAFVLGGPPLIAGAYQYELFQGGDAAAGGDPLDGNWYLRSDLAPTTDFYRGVPASMLRYGRETIGSLQQRTGNRWWRTPARQVERIVTEPASPPPVATCPQTDFVVYFEWDRSNLNQEAQETIDSALNRARQCSLSGVTVIGHTDTSGSAAYNVGLSERRSSVVRDALVAGGVPAGAIQTDARGETDLARATPDGVREPLNRRAAVTIRVGAPQVAGPPPAPRTRTVVDTIPASIDIRGQGVWARIQGTDGEFESDDVNAVTVDENTWFAQAGYDFLISQNEDGTVIGSVFAQYGELDTDVANVDFGDIASLETTGWGVGGGVTWYSPGGAYADGQVSFNWLDGDVTSDTLGELTGDGMDGTVWAISVEGGYRHEMSPNYYVVPQAQLIYSDADFDDFTDPFGGDVSVEDGDSLLGRLGVAIEYQDVPDGDRDTTRLHAYGLANVYYEFMGDTGVVVDGIDLQDNNDEVWGELAAGLTYLVNANWSVYAEGGYLSSLENWGDSEILRGSLGVRYNW